MGVSSNAINLIVSKFVMGAKKGPRIVIAKRYNETGPMQGQTRR
jgi:hypothetical protein